ncbi:hypothetical protein [Streptacidiphilus sp. MAP5-52]|uniref:hypothetical protein n=1 Tax=Streptacidiphilus sp. MAP5-52 TaxID=3156267 RepID=UPI0035187A91
MIEQIFELSRSASRSLADAVLLRPVPAPGPDAVWSTSARPVLLAVRSGGWAAARVLAWTWNPTGKPVLWRCAVDLDGTVVWLGYDARLMRPLVPGPAAR